MPLFSIITVCFNASDLIVDTMKSVYSQAYDNYEYLIIDGLSKDNTLQVIDETKDAFDSRGITKVLSEKDQGIYDAMNKGARIATGKYCCFLNAGDTFASADVLEKLATQMADNKFVYGDIYSVSTTFKKFVQAKSMDVVEDTLNMPYCHQALFVEREILLAQPLDLKYKNAADYNQCVQLYKSNLPYLHADVIVANYQIGGKSETAALSYLKEKFDIREKNGFAKPTQGENQKTLQKTKLRIFIKRLLPASMTEKIRRSKAKNV